MVKIEWPKQRAWGWYATIVRTPWFCLKLLRFKRQGRMSLQRHFWRTEIWFILNTLQIRKIPPLTWHTYRAHKRPIYIIELQYGSRVHENDIQRRPMKVDLIARGINK